MSITYKDFKFNDIANLSIRSHLYEPLTKDQEQTLSEFVKEFSSKDKDFTTPQTLYEYREDGLSCFSIMKRKL